MGALLLFTTFSQHKRPLVWRQPGRPARCRPCCWPGYHWTPPPCCCCWCCSRSSCRPPCRTSRPPPLRHSFGCSSCRRHCCCPTAQRDGSIGRSCRPAGKSDESCPLCGRLRPHRPPRRTSSSFRAAETENESGVGGSRVAICLVYYLATCVHISIEGLLVKTVF